MSELARSHAHAEVDKFLKIQSSPPPGGFLGRLHRPPSPQNRKTLYNKAPIRGSARVTKMSRWRVSPLYRERVCVFAGGTNVVFYALFDMLDGALGFLNFSRKSSGYDLGIDLGTVNTLICTASKGVVLREPSVVAIDTRHRPPRVEAVGLAAHEMIGRTPEHIHTTRPLRDGVIAEFEWAEVLLRRFIEKVIGDRSLFKGRPGRVVIGLPSCVTEVERRAVADAAYSTGAHIVHLVPEPMAAAIGAGMPVDKAIGSMIVDIGGGTTDVAVLSLNGIVTANSLRVAGDELNDNICDYLKQEFLLRIGAPTAEDIKIRLGSACPRTEKEPDMEVRGVSLKTGLPQQLRIEAGAIRECLEPTLAQIVQVIKETLEVTPPELAADIADRGMALAGGGALLAGMDALIARETEVPVHIAPDPLSCVVLGTEKLLNDPTFQPILDATEYDSRQYG